MILLLSLFACDSEAPAEPAAPAPAPAAAPAPTVPAPAAAPPASSNPNQLSGYTGTFANDPKLSPVQVAAWSDDYRVKRNEIFARYGRAFKSEDLQQHFGAAGWYQVNADFKDSVLTSNDNANVALIKSFEGESSRAKAISNGEYHSGDGTNLTLTDATHAELADSSDDMYNWTREERNWASLGDWIVTWEGPKKWNPADSTIRNARLWDLDHEASTVSETYELKL